MLRLAIANDDQWCLTAAFDLDPPVNAINYLHDELAVASVKTVTVPSIMRCRESLVEKVETAAVSPAKESVVQDLHFGIGDVFTHIQKVNSDLHDVAFIDADNGPGKDIGQFIGSHGVQCRSCCQSECFGVRFPLVGYGRVVPSVSGLKCLFDLVQLSCSNVITPDIHFTKAVEGGSTKGIVVRIDLNMAVKNHLLFGLS